MGFRSLAQAHMGTSGTSWMPSDSTLLFSKLSEISFPNANTLSLTVIEFKLTYLFDPVFFSMPFVRFQTLFWKALCHPVSHDGRAAYKRRPHPYHDELEAERNLLLSRVCQHSGLSGLTPNCSSEAQCSRHCLLPDITREGWDGG